MIEFITVRDISKDDSFRFSDALKGGHLAESIKETGVLCPLAVTGSPGNFTLVAGFSRMSAALKSGVETVPARIKPHGLSLAEFFVQELQAHAAARTFTLTEKARILRISGRLGCPSSLYSRTCRLIEAPEEPHIRKQITAVLEFSPDVQAYISEYGLSLKQSSMFRGLSDREQERIIAMAHMLGIRGVELRKIIDLMQHAAGKRKLPVIDVINSCTGTSGDEVSENRNQALKDIKKRLMKQVYPVMEHTNSELRTLSRGFRGHDLVNLAWDETLEKPEIRLNAVIESAEDIVKIADIFSETENKESLKSMISVIKS